MDQPGKMLVDLEYPASVSPHRLEQPVTARVPYLSAIISIMGDITGTDIATVKYGASRSGQVVSVQS